MSSLSKEAKKAFEGNDKDVFLLRGKTKELYQSISIKGIAVCLYYGVLYAVAGRYELVALMVLFIIARIYFFLQKNFAVRLFVAQIHLQMVLLAYFGVTALGWQFGAQYLLFCAIALTYMSPFKRPFVIFAFGTIEGILFIYLHFAYSTLPAKLVFPHPWDAVFFVIGVFPAVFMVLYSGYKAELSTMLHNMKIYSMNQQLERMAGYDELTGIMNRRAMQRLLESSWSSKNSSGDKFFIAMGDIDYFKKVNDNLGHAAGDYVLIELAALFSSSLRHTDYVCRWGGEEFLFLFTYSNSQSMMKDILERIRLNIESKPFEWEGKNFNVTITFGCASSENKQSLNEVIAMADKCLYEGKSSGRNMVLIEDC